MSLARTYALEMSILFTWQASFMSRAVYSEGLGSLFTGFSGERSVLAEGNGCRLKSS